MLKQGKSFHSITEVSKELNLPNYVLRFWEEKFIQILPLKNNGRRYYREEDIRILVLIKDLLYNKGYTIKGAQKYLESTTTKEVKQQEPYLNQDNNIYKIHILLEKLLKLKSKLEE